MKYALLFLTFLLSIPFLSGQNTVPSPDEFFPEPLGSQFYPHYQIIDYFERIADQSEQVQLVEYGRTNQMRPLVYAIISAPENMARLEDIRQNNLRRTGLVAGNSKDEDIAIVWLSYTVHGNEASSPAAAVKTLYELVRPDNVQTKEWLKNTVVIMDPVINPDGYSRYVNWIRNSTHKITTPNPLSREHQEPWPGGRVNHYLFDLNRDWAWATQVETQQRIPHYRQWMPHIHVDFHEQGYNSPYYFAPAAKPFHEYITSWQRNFQVAIGKNNARYFDKEGWMYFTKERFDLFYPSYGDTYPVFNGSIGMTYEQAGHGRAGVAILLENQDTLKLIDRIEHHTTTGLATIEIGSQNASELAKNFQQYFDNARNNPAGDYATFVISSENGEDKLRRITQLLDLHQIQYGRSSADRRTQGFDYQTGTEKEITISSSDLLIPAAQPMGVMAQILLEPAPFLEDSVTYDITAWSLPFAHGLKAYATQQKIGMDAGYDFADPMPQIVDDQPYSYIFKWESLDDAAFLGQLLSQNVRVRFASSSFQANDQSYSPGTLLVNRGDNYHLGEDYDKIIQEAAYQHRRKLTTVTSGFSQSGPDFGSGQMQLIERPKVAVVYGDQVSSYAYGQTWHYLEEVLQYPFLALEYDQLGNANLKDVNTLILVEGRYTDSGGKLTDWIRGGGKLIILGNAIQSLAGNDLFKINKKDTNQKTDSISSSSLPKYGNRERDFIKKFIPGAIVRAKVDHTHPLAYGLPSYYHALKINNDFYDLCKSCWNVVYLDKNPKVYGFIGSDARKHLGESSLVATQRIGRGKVIYFSDNPLFRAFWQQGQFLMSNALFFED